jgi:ADP-ribose pyrophosphatase YjhB (NUDIX family)
LRNAYPKAEVVQTHYLIEDEVLVRQKARQKVRGTEGGAIGIVWLPDGTIPLVERSRAHPGWALPGGTVERGEAFVDAFRREVLEEVDVRLGAVSLLCLELRLLSSAEGNSHQTNVATFVANALAGEKWRQTERATDEGLIVRAFRPEAIPHQLIFNDGELLRQVISSGRGNRAA